MPLAGCTNTGELSARKRVEVEFWGAGATNELRLYSTPLPCDPLTYGPSNLFDFALWLLLCQLHLLFDEASLRLATLKFTKNTERNYMC